MIGKDQRNLREIDQKYLHSEISHRDHEGKMKDHREGQTFAKDLYLRKMKDQDLSYKIIGVALELHKNLGPSLLESS